MRRYTVPVWRYKSARRVKYARKTSSGIRCIVSEKRRKRSLKKNPLVFRYRPKPNYFREKNFAKNKQWSTLHCTRNSFLDLGLSGKIRKCRTTVEENARPPHPWGHPLRIPDTTNEVNQTVCTWRLRVRRRRVMDRNPKQTNPVQGEH